MKHIKLTTGCDVAIAVAICLTVAAVAVTALVLLYKYRKYELDNARTAERERRKYDTDSAMRQAVTELYAKVLDGKTAVTVAACREYIELLREAVAAKSEAAEAAAAEEGVDTEENGDGTDTDAQNE